MSGKLEDFRAPAKLKLSALWASTMFCYVYCDFFGLFRPGKLMGMNAGKIAPLGDATPGVLVGVSIMMAIPSVMVFLSLALPPGINRWLNILLGLAYTGIMLLTMAGGAPPYYVMFGAIEIALTLGVAWVAATWPRTAA